jgi:hypothetical protein
MTAITNTAALIAVVLKLLVVGAALTLGTICWFMRGGR